MESEHQRARGVRGGKKFKASAQGKAEGSVVDPQLHEVATELQAVHQSPAG